MCLSLDKLANQTGIQLSVKFQLVIFKTVLDGVDVMVALLGVLNGVDLLNKIEDAPSFDTSSVHHLIEGAVLRDRVVTFGQCFG